MIAFQIPASFVIIQLLNPCKYENNIQISRFISILYHCISCRDVLFMNM